MTRIVVPDPTGDVIVTLSDNVIQFTSKFAVDTDGSGPLHNDPYAQADTTLHFNGKALNADVDRYVVLPPQIIKAVSAPVLGCLAEVVNNSNGLGATAVVGDVGPSKKIGEGSVALASALGLNPSPLNGGTCRHIITYVIYPGRPANLDGKLFRLQPYA